MTSKAPSNRFWLAIVCFFVIISCFSFVFAAGAPPTGESLDQLYEKAKKEGGKITLYAPLSNRAMEVIPPAFMKKFPGLTVNHIDATPDQLVARLTAEARGGRVLATCSADRCHIWRNRRSKVAGAVGVAGSRGFPGTMKSDLWVATDMQFYIAGWNTNLVKKGDEPKSFEDLAHPKWKDPMMAEARDFQMLIGLAKRKYNSDEKASTCSNASPRTKSNFIRGIRSWWSFWSRDNAPCVSPAFRTIFHRGLKRARRSSPC